MSRILGLLLLSLLPAPGFGDLKVIKSVEDSFFTTYELTVSPAPEPNPIFEHRLAPREIDLLPGNAATYYERAARDVDTQNRAAVKVAGEQNYYDWQDPDVCPISALPTAEVLGAIKPFDLDALDQATRTRTCEWGLVFDSITVPEYIAMQVDKFTWMRTLGQALALRARVAIANKNYVEAITDLQTLYKLAQDGALTPLSDFTTFATGNAILANQRMTELIAQPAAPNLYWALSELPDPLVEYRAAVRMDLSIGWRMAPFLRDAESANHTPEEWNEFWKSLAASDPTDYDNVPPAKLPGGEFNPALTGLSAYSHAKRRLIAWGYAADTVGVMPVGQVLAIYTARVYQQQADFVERTFYVPWPKAKVLLEEQEAIEESEAIWNNPDREIFPLATEFVRGARSYRAIEERIRRDLAALRVIEALRMHAAEHDGQLPATLAEVSCVPVPDNPATGEAFVYQLDGATAVLELPASDGLTISARYEITVAE